MPSGLVIQAVPGVFTCSFRAEVIAAADSRGGFTGSALAGIVATRVSAVAASIAAVRRRVDDFMAISLPGRAALMSGVASSGHRMSGAGV